MAYNSFDHLLVDRSTSTNDLAKQHAEQGAPHGFWVSSRIQEQGRGRLGRVWTSIEGNLFISFVLRIEDKTLWSWVPLAVAVGAVNYLQEHFPDLDLKLKWPNDIYLEHSKLGGILCESNLGPKPSIVAGLGLNCIAAPEGTRVPSTDLSSALGYMVSVDPIRDPLAQHVLNAVNRLMEQGPKFIEEIYSEKAYFPPGSRISWDLGKHTGTTIGLGSMGELQVRLTDGMIRSLYAEDVSLGALSVRGQG
jgi:BirA family biotin operon repressor/biotin-[acetyl-CoA-carboxylase] ligase